MKPNKAKKTAGRPPTPEAEKASKPNVTVPNYIQDDARKAAEKKGIGYSAFVTDAITRHIARTEIEFECKAGIGGLESVSSEKNSPRRKRA